MSTLVLSNMTMAPKITFILIVMSWSAQSHSLTLSDFLKKVESQSLEIKIEKAATEESKAKAQGVRIPPPMLGFMNMKEAGTSTQGIEVSQEIPFPTKISKEKETRNIEAEFQQENLEYRQKEIFTQARIAFFEFWSAFEKNSLIKEKRNWLIKHVRLSRSATRSDSSAQIHLLGTESELDLLENEVLESDAALIQKRNLLSTYAPEANFEQAEPQTPPIQIFFSKPSAQSSKVRLKEIELKLADANKSLKKQSYLPDFFLRYRGYNGNEVIAKNEETMIGITLPFLFFWQPHAESSEASARLMKAEAELRKAKVESSASLQYLRSKIESLEKQLKALQSVLIPRSQKRMKLVENLSPRSMEGLEEHRSVMLSHLDLRLKAVEVRMELEKALAELMIITEGALK